MSQKRHQEYLSGARSGVSKALHRRKWPLRLLADRVGVPPKRLKAFLSSPFGYIEADEELLDRLIRSAMSDKAPWGPSTTRLLRASRHYQSLYQ